MRMVVFCLGGSSNSSRVLSRASSNVPGFLFRTVLLYINSRPRCTPWPGGLTVTAHDVIVTVLRGDLQGRGRPLPQVHVLRTGPAHTGSLRRTTGIVGRPGGPSRVRVRNWRCIVAGGSEATPARLNGVVQTVRGPSHDRGGWTREERGVDRGACHRMRKLGVVGGTPPPQPEEPRGAPSRIERKGPGGWGPRGPGMERKGGAGARRRRPPAAPPQHRRRQHLRRPQIRRPGRRRLQRFASPLRPCPPEHTRWSLFDQ